MAVAVVNNPTSWSNIDSALLLLGSALLEFAVLDDLKLDEPEDDRQYPKE